MLRSLQHLRLVRDASPSQLRTLLPGPAHSFTQVRTKTKKKSSSSSSSSASGKILQVRSDVQQLVDWEKYSDGMRNTVESLKSTYSRMRSGMVSPDFLDDLPVEAYGSRTPLKSLAQVSVRDARTVFITTFDQGVVTAVEKAVRGAGLNLNPIADEQGRLKVPIARPSRESRVQLRDAAQKEAEAAKVATRLVRRKALDRVKQVKDDISKDDSKRLEHNIQLLTDQFIERIDNLQKTKVEAIMEPDLTIRK